MIRSILSGLSLVAMLWLTGTVRGHSTIGRLYRWWVTRPLWVYHVTAVVAVALLIIPAVMT